MYMIEYYCEHWQAYCGGSGELYCEEAAQNCLARLAYKYKQTAWRLKNPTGSVIATRNRAMIGA